MPITCIIVVRRKEFAQRVRVPLSQERKTFSGIFSAFSESSLNFVHFEKNDQLYNLKILEVIDSEKCGFLNARNSYLRTPVQSQRIHAC